MTTRKQAIALRRDMEDDFDWDEFAKRAGTLMDEWRACHVEVSALLRPDFPELIDKLDDLYSYGSTGKE